MISHERKVLFIDIMKNAGTAIIQELGKYMKVEGKHHSITNMFADHPVCTRLLPEHIRDYWKFTVIRNPWDRMLSLYAWGQYKGSAYGQKDFMHFIHMMRNKEIPHFSTAHYADQLAWITDEAGRLQVNYIARMEHIQENWQELCVDWLHVPYAELPLVNESERKFSRMGKHYSFFYDRQTRNLVGSMYDRDVDFFGYKFEEKAS